MQDHVITLMGEELALLPEKAIWWEAQRALILSDLHVGKVTHFRRNGIQAPVSIIEQELNRLGALVHYFGPDKLIIVGDLFHSTLNAEWELFSGLIKSFDNTEVILVRGNHDRMPAFVLRQSNIRTMSIFMLQPFVFSHHPLENNPHYVISGHVHPGIVLRGTAALPSLRLPCYYFGKHYALLPAFGNFTGLMSIRKTSNDRIFAIAGEKIIEV